MNVFSVKNVIITVTVVLGLITSAFGVTKFLVLKPVYDVELAGVSKQIIQMQQNNEAALKNRKREDAKNWYEHYNAEVETLTRECAKDESNILLRLRLEQMQTLRSEAKARWDRLMIE